MKIKTQLEISTDWLVKDFRVIFMSMIKKVFEQNDRVLLHQLYGTKNNPVKTNKPFTFHIYFPEFKKFEDNKIFCGNKVNFYFSTNDEMLATAFYNGIKSHKKFTIGENTPIEFQINNIWVEPQKKFKADEAIFKTLGPILVNKEGDNLKYLAPVDEGFHDAFIDIIYLQANSFDLNVDKNDIEFEIKQMKKLPLSHYRQTMTAWLGTFVLKAPKEVLQLVYDTGIGVRRSQGFGMLEKI